MITLLRKSSPPSSITEPGWSVDEYTPSDTPIALCIRGYHASVVVAPLGAGLSSVTVWLPREVAAELGILPAQDTRIERALEIFDELSGGAYFTTSDIIKVIDILRGAP